jgi:hypothetical protein
MHLGKTLPKKSVIERALNKGRRVAVSKFFFTVTNMIESFPSFAPNSAGKYKARARLTISSINSVFPAILNLQTELLKSSLEVFTPEQFAIEISEKDIQVEHLEELFNKYGSDKATIHDYHKIYAAILNPFESVTSLVEIGLGTNNTDTISNMGAHGRPGASLRAFRDFLPDASIFGADIDSRILFQEERITTTFVDQTDKTSFSGLSELLDGRMPQLIIDDGLHSPDANVNTLNFGLSHVVVGGWVVIEDISPTALELWLVVSGILPISSYRTFLIRAKGGLVFAVQRTM